MGKTDYASAPLTPAEAEAVKQGVILVRHDPNDPAGRLRAVLEGICMALNMPMPTEAEIQAMINDSANDA